MPLPNCLRILSEIMAVRSSALLAPIMRVNLVGSQIVTMVNFKRSQLLKFIPRRPRVSRQAIAEYIKGLIKLYSIANKSKKSEYLDQAQEITGRSRRTVQRYLSINPQQISAGMEILGRGRKPSYPPELLLPHIRKIWKSMEMICAERMVAALPKWLPSYKDPACTDEIKQLLLSMSRCTLERLLSKIRAENIPRRGLSTTTSALRAFKAKIPINTLDRQVTRPGYTQVDSVSHCGNSAAGEFISSVTLTDIFSGWTVNHATFTKKAIRVRHALVHLKRQLPFALLAVNTDSGSEFINEEIFELMNSNPVFRAQNQITFTRSRPYKKNDNCYVEQRNYTHVRQLFGYYRYEDPALVNLMNDIYDNYWNPLQNYFLPCQKLREKIRVGAKIVKKHDKPTTPADRLLASPYLSSEQKEAIKQKQRELNPFELAESLELKLESFFRLYRQSIAHKEKKAA